MEEETRKKIEGEIDGIIDNLKKNEEVSILSRKHKRIVRVLIVLLFIAIAIIGFLAKKPDSFQKLIYQGELLKVEPEKPTVFYSAIISLNNYQQKEKTTETIINSKEAKLLTLGKDVYFIKVRYLGSNGEEVETKTIISQKVVKKLLETGKWKIEPRRKK